MERKYHFLSFQLKTHTRFSKWIEEKIILQKSCCRRCDQSSLKRFHYLIDSNQTLMVVQSVNFSNGMGKKRQHSSLDWLSRKLHGHHSVACLKPLWLSPKDSWFYFCTGFSPLTLGLHFKPCLSWWIALAVVGCGFFCSIPTNLSS